MILLSEAQEEQIRHHGASEFPLECCGVLLGDVEQDVKITPVEDEPRPREERSAGSAVWALMPLVARVLAAFLDDKEAALRLLERNFATAGASRVRIAETDPDLLHDAPVTAPVRRLDEAKARLETRGCAVETIESLASDIHNLHPLQESFVRSHGQQCGYCTPGQIVSAVSLRICCFAASDSGRARMASMLRWMSTPPTVITKSPAAAVPASSAPAA